MKDTRSHNIINPAVHSFCKHSGIFSLDNTPITAQEPALADKASMSIFIEQKL